MNTSKHDNPPGLDQPRPLWLRLIHWSVAGCFAGALATGYTAFDFDFKMPVNIRDTLFIIHRLCGMASGILLLIWVFAKVAKIAKSRWWKFPRLACTFHLVIAITGIAVPFAPWIARALDGRWHELYRLLPQANLVSHPTVPLTYRLLQWHKDLIVVIEFLLAFHIIAAAIHVFWLGDNSWSSMRLWRNSRAPDV